MQNIDLKNPESFQSYNRWKSLQKGVVEHRTEIKQHKNRLSELTAKLPELRKANRRAVDKRDANIDEIEATEKALKDTEAEIKKVKKAWAEAEQDLQDHKIKIEEAKIEFLREAAPYVSELLNEFLPVIDRAAEMKTNIQAWKQFDDLRIPNLDSEVIHFWSMKKRNQNGLLKGFKQRHEEITTGDFKTRDFNN